MEAVIGGLAVAAATGAGWIAYAHPQSFRPVGIMLAVLIFVAGIFVIGWQVGANYVREALTVTADPKALIEVLDTSKIVIITSMWLLGALVYDVILLSLPLWLKKEAL